MHGDQNYERKRDLNFRRKQNSNKYSHKKLIYIIHIGERIMNFVK